MKQSGLWVSARLAVAFLWLCWGCASAQDIEPDETLLKSCAVCHGENGISPGEDWPHLAGQQFDYMVGEMQAYRDGSRENAEMAALSTPLSDEQIEALSRYYANTPKPEVSLDDLSAGAQAGRNRAGTCFACHGMKGLAVTPVWPSLAGQKQNYLEAQLKAFRAGTREDPVMSAQAAGLSDEDIANLAMFFSELGS